MKETIRTFRRFNRFYTRFLGLFNRHLLNSSLNLAEARTLFEIVASPGEAAAKLSRSLGMDRSQLSRIIARLLRQNLIRRHGKPEGGKALPLHPTLGGRKLLKEIETAADHQAADLIGSLDAGKSGRLRVALSEVEGILRSEKNGYDRGRGDVRLREAEAGDLGWIITRHARIYGFEYGFTQEFETYVLLGLAEYLNKDRSRSRVWIAEQGGVAAGSVGIVEQTKDRAQLRWLLVEPHARGLGAGRVLVEQAIEFSKGQGYDQVILWTLQDLHAARALYKSFGFTLAEEKNGEMGGQPMIEECWALTLNAESENNSHE
jgi:DNA-binding MarR family transcriptional regulator/GNAT superfamily N-acetyltransferase